jgi:nitroimidazol reductase NimA-like FMN-containing flavoprotein (pyridoxamine 5'-phosphate oxidase superfamily)
MSVFYNRSDLIEISADECVRLLQSRRVGRIGFVADGQPLIFPVNYAFDGESVVFRTDTGTKLDRAPLTKVCFEVDEIDEENGEGWDVLIQGRADDITESIDERSEFLRGEPVQPFAPGLKWHWIRVVRTEISGRRIVAR